jgi:hypothetical protein
MVNGTIVDWAIESINNVCKCTQAKILTVRQIFIDNTNNEHSRWAHWSGRIRPPNHLFRAITVKDTSHAPSVYTWTHQLPENSSIVLTWSIVYNNASIGVILCPVLLAFFWATPIPSNLTAWSPSPHRTTKGRFQIDCTLSGQYPFVCKTLDLRGI